MSESEQAKHFSPETVDGFLMALTGSYLDLVALLEEKGIVTRAQVADRLESWKSQLESSPAALHWIEVTVKNFRSDK